MRRARNQGFTLVELMVTIAIVAILLAVALPSFEGSMRSNRVATATNELISTLSLARSEAIRSPGGALVCTTSDGVDCDASDWNTGWMVWVDWNGDGDTTHAQDRLLRYVQANNKISIGADSAGGAAFEHMIRFDSRGRTVEHGVELEVQPVECPDGPELRRTVSVTATGQVRTERATCT